MAPPQSSRPHGERRLQPGIGNAANAARATKPLVDLEPMIRAIHGDGKTSLNQIPLACAEVINQDSSLGVPTQRRACQGSGDTLMEILIIGALLGVIPAVVAAKKGRNFLGWWLFGARCS